MEAQVCLRSCVCPAHSVPHYPSSCVAVQALTERDCSGLFLIRVHILQQTVLGSWNVVSAAIGAS